MRLSRLRLAAAVSLVSASMTVASTAAFAFDVPDDQSCGGLVCDLGLFGHKTVRAQAPAATAVPAPAPLKAAPPIAEAARPARRHVAKAAPVAPRSAPKVAPVAVAPEAAPAEPVKVAKVAKPRATPAVADTALRDFVQTGMAIDNSAPILPPPRSEPVVLANPYVFTGRQTPLAFQSVDPTVGAR